MMVDSEIQIKDTRQTACGPRLTTDSVEPPTIIAIFAKKYLLLQPIYLKTKTGK